MSWRGASLTTPKSSLLRSIGNMVMSGLSGLHCRPFFLHPTPKNPFRERAGLLSKTTGAGLGIRARESSMSVVCRSTQAVSRF
jgi:hypothetical protein